MLVHGTDMMSLNKYITLLTTTTLNSATYFFLMSEFFITVTNFQYKVYNMVFVKLKII